MWRISPCFPSLSKFYDCLHNITWGQSVVIPKKNQSTSFPEMYFSYFNPFSFTIFPPLENSCVFSNLFGLHSCICFSLRLFSSQTISHHIFIMNISLYTCVMNKTEYMCYNQTGDISTQEGTPLKPSRQIHIPRKQRRINGHRNEANESMDSYQ